MITLSNDEMLTLLDELTAQELRVYMYLVSTNTHEWTEHSIRKLAKALKAGRRTIQKNLESLKSKQYIETKQAETFTAVRIETRWSQMEPPWSQTEPPSFTSIRNIKRERVYYFILLKIIFLFSNKNYFLSLSDIPYMEQKGGVKWSHPGVKRSHPPEKYSLTGEFYEQVRDMGIRMNDKLKAQLDYVGAEEVTGIYERIIWDEAIRKPSTIFLKELAKAVKEKQKAETENRRQASNYQTWEGSRELSLKEIYDSYRRNRNMKQEKVIKFWKEKSKYFGYTETEIAEFLENQDSGELERESKLTGGSGENADEMGLSLNALEEE